MSAREGVKRSDFNLLTNFTDLLCNFLCNGNALTWERLCQKLIFGSQLTVQGYVQNALRHCNELFILCNKIRFTVQANQGTEIASTVRARQNRSFACFTITALGSNLLSLQSKDFNGLVKIAFCFCQGFLTIHHACSRMLTELVHFCSCNAHMKWLFATAYQPPRVLNQKGLGLLFV